MKKTFTLFFAILFTVGLIGQTENFRNGLKDHKGQVFEILEMIGMDNDSKQFILGSKQSMDSLIFEEFYEFDGGWRNSDKETYLWDDDGKENMNIISVWGGSNGESWLDYSKTEYTYNSEGKILKMLTREREEIDGEWLDFSMVDFTYGDGTDITAIMSVWSPALSIWIEWIKYEYTFDTEGKLVGIVDYSKIEDSTIWTFSEKYEYSYNDDANLIKEKMLWWNSETSTWTNSEKYDYYYEGLDVLVRVDWSDWNLNALEWNLNSKIIFGHDDNGNIASYEEYWWDNETQDWLVEEKCNYTYNNSYTFDELLLPDNVMTYFFNFNNIVFNHMLVKEEVFEANDTAWDEDTRTTYFYSENTSGLEENTGDAFLVYPNPVSDKFYVDFCDDAKAVVVELFNIQGKLLFSKTVHSKQAISVEGIGNGIYFYRIVYDKKTVGGRIIVK